MILDVKSVRVFKVHSHHSKYSVRCLVFPFDYASFAERIFVVGEVAGSINVQSNLRMKCQRYIIHPIRAPIITHPSFLFFYCSTQNPWNAASSFSISQKIDKLWGIDFLSDPPKHPICAFSLWGDSFEWRRLQLLQQLAFLRAGRGPGWCFDVWAVHKAVVDL